MPLQTINSNNVVGNVIWYGAASKLKYKISAAQVTIDEPIRQHIKLTFNDKLINSWNMIKFNTILSMKM